LEIGKVREVNTKVLAGIIDNGLKPKIKEDAKDCFA